MIKRPECLCEGKIRRIEELYTVRDGLQINIPEKVEEFRQLSAENKLECPCRCGLLLTLKAGPKMQRKQHFAAKHSSVEYKCRVIEETDTTIFSKIIIKCWLDDVFGAEASGIQYNVPVSSLRENIGKQYEFTHYVPNYKFGICYERLEANINSKKLKYMMVEQGLNMLCISDISNCFCQKQYPEYVMRMQNVQNFCMFLKPGIDGDYFSSNATISYFIEDRKGFWQEIRIIDGCPLADFKIKDSCLYYCNEPVEELVDLGIETFRVKEKAEAEKELQIAEEQRIKVKKAEAAAKKRAEEAEVMRMEKERKKAERTALYKKLDEENIQYHLAHKAQKKENTTHSNSSSSPIMSIGNMKTLNDEKEKGRMENQRSYLANFPVKNALVSFMASLVSVEGDFFSKQGYGTTKYYHQVVSIDKVWYKKEKDCIELIDKEGVRSFIHLQTNYSDRFSMEVSNTYIEFPFYSYKNDATAAIEAMKKILKCTPREASVHLVPVCHCELVEKMANIPICYDSKKGICGLPSSACNYRR